MHRPSISNPDRPGEPVEMLPPTQPSQEQVVGNEHQRSQDHQSLKRVLEGLFLISLVFTFFFALQQGSLWLVSLVLAGWAVVALAVHLSLQEPRGLYRGLQNATWLLCVALCFLIGDLWAWIFLPLGVILILAVCLRGTFSSLWRLPSSPTK